MRRREFIGLLGSSAVTWPLVSRPAMAQSSGASRKIGYLHPFQIDPNSFIITLLRQRWRELGYVEGETVLLRSAQGDVTRMPGLIAELIGLGADVLVVVGLAAVKAAMAATPVRPVVAIDLETDPVRAGLIGSWAKPGGDLTGLFLDQASLTGKWLELLREVEPGLKRVALAWDPTTRPDQLEAAQSAAHAFGIEGVTLRVSRPEEFEGAFAALGSGTPTGVVLLGSPTLTASAHLFAGAAIKYKLPTVCFFKPISKAGGLMTYGPVLEAYFPRAISMAHKILNGSKPNEMPIEGPDRYELVVNMKTAKALGLTVPATLLAATDELIE
jgi:putative ABC transport system substrate-binding protein